MVLEPVDPNVRFHERRARAQHRRKLRRTAFLFALVISAVCGGLAVWVTSRGASSSVNDVAKRTTSGTTTSSQQNPLLPKEIRGIHVTMGLASLPGELAKYISLKDEGLNTIALDVKDETGAVAFSPPEVPLVSAIEANGGYYKAAAVAGQVHSAGLYLIGRIAVFEDPVLSARRPEMAVQRSDGSRWLNYNGLGWTNQYDKRVWKYNVSIAKAAARAGFDEIQFDYVRFPSDGPVSSAVWPGKTKASNSATINNFLRYAMRELKPFHVRVSVDVFGLAATGNNDVGIGQSPKQISHIVDAICPMVYPSHFGPGQYGLPDPQAVPGTTVAYALADFLTQMRGGRADIVPWLQDFSMGGHNFTLSDLQDEVLNARRSRTRGFLLWNAKGIYTPGGLQPAGSNVVG